MNVRRPLVLGLALAAAIVSLAPTAVDAATFKFTEADVEDIVGEVQKPDVTVVISRENLNKAYKLELQESFLDKIVESVEHEPF